MAASKPTSSLSKQRHILSTESHLGALAGGLGCCPLDYEAYPPQSECRVNGTLGIRSLIGFGSLVGPLSHSVLYLQVVLARRSPSSDFGENQLSRGLISLSLLLTSHLRIFQHPRVRSFTACYCSFNLLISRSPPLRVYCLQLVALFALGFPSPPPHSGLGLLQTITRRLIMQKAGGHHACAWLPHIVCNRLQILFTPLTRVLFTFPSRY
jgi:hypothetical protein